MNDFTRSVMPRGELNVPQDSKPDLTRDRAGIKAAILAFQTLVMRWHSSVSVTCVLYGDLV